MKNKNWDYSKYSCGFASLRENQSSIIDKTESRSKRNEILKKTLSGAYLRQLPVTQAAG
jgi:hypothetical protein